MKIKQHAAVLGLVAAGALLLSACGSDNNAPGNTGGSTSSAAGSIACAGKKSVNGDGSSAQGNAMTEFTASYVEACKDFNVAYNVSSSGDGIKNFLAKQVDFAGSDSPLKADEITKATERCAGSAPLHLPLVFGPVAIAYNLPGVELTLTPDLVAKVFSGVIKTWNDPAIMAANPSATLPAKAIGVVFRSGQSGTTDNFQKYLAAAAPQSWTKGDGKEFKGGIGDGKAKSADVASAVKATEGGITYVEVSFAKSNKLGIAKLDSGAGGVELTDASAGKAIANAKLQTATTPGDLVLDLKALYADKTAGSYPLVLVTYEIVCAKSADADTAAALKNFLTVASTTGQDRLPKIGYVPLPAEFRTKLTESIKSIS
ncbi:MULTISPECIES: phosphate ABC transporter substrate-binding protein PstS [unclassified Crossiella]|uniref:phosphate ABC transporter substrate-binding protein PstS n=1 Tax=unclassified Crossiella TaxID=2620835 RepID=UPI001FFE3B1C|nr:MULTISPECIES: phosphate ABC transporter substrate-binding protein PstS [unclassified Crossiella]MCK2236570.1 phosphate ABC transporter substrate-binding protein PstS [Crossiella sp. S99.2]MCK2250237.1 phosphate ABC transporter substrate-binding protein PstS [Crossiella sp. S99.1]